MPPSGYKSVTVPAYAHKLAEQLVKLGLEDSIGKAFTNAIKEYVERRKGLIKEIREVKAKWSLKQP